MSKESEELSNAGAVSKPHDRFFKRSMQEQKIAIDLLKSKLPSELLAEMDLSTLTLVNNEHILDGLELLESDCVCRCRIRGEEGYIIIGAEHVRHEVARKKYMETCWSSTQAPFSVLFIIFATVPLNFSAATHY